MSNLCRAGKIAGCVKTERLEAEAVSVAAHMTPNTVSGRFQGLRYAGGRVESDSPKREGGEGVEAPDFRACLTVAECHRTSHVPSNLPPAAWPDAQIGANIATNEITNANPPIAFKNLFFIDFASLVDLFSAHSEPRFPTNFLRAADECDNHKNRFWRAFEFPEDLLTPF